MTAAGVLAVLLHASAKASKWRFLVAQRWSSLQDAFRTVAAGGFVSDAGKVMLNCIYAEREFRKLRAKALNKDVATADLQWPVVNTTSIKTITQVGLAKATMEPNSCAPRLASTSLTPAQAEMWLKRSTKSLKLEDC